MSVFAVLMAIGLMTPATAPRAADANDFHEAVANAYGHYRESEFYLRTGNSGVAGFELEALEVKWRAIVSRFAAHPPAPYAADPHWAADITQITQHIIDGRAHADRGDTKAARTALRPVRSILGALRRRNGIFLFSDCVDEANKAMAALFKFRHAPPNFAQPDGVTAARRAATKTRNWYAKCRDMASPAMAKEDEFKRLMESSLYSLDRIGVALDTKNERMFINILRELRSSDRILFLRFG